MSQDSSRDYGALAPWAPDQPLTLAEVQFLELLASEQSDLGSFRTRSKDGRQFVAEFGSEAAALAARWLTRGHSAHKAAIWQVAEGAFGLAVRLEIQAAGRLSNDLLGPAGRLAETLRIRGNRLAAKAIQEDILSRLRHRPGPEDPDTLAAELQLAETLLLLGLFRDARVLQEHVLESRINSIGEDHPDTAKAMGELGETLLTEGDFSGATKLLRKALDIWRRSHGPENPATLTAEDSVAVALWAQGDLSGARALQEHVLEVSRRGGVNTRELLAYEGNLAATFTFQGHLTEARAIQQRILETRTQLFGRLHPDTIGSLSNLAWTLRSLGDLSGARVLAEEVLDSSRELLGAGHPNTFAVEGILAETLRDQGDEETLRCMALDGLAKLPTVAASARRIFARYAFFLRVLESQSTAAVALHGKGTHEPDWIAALLDLLPSTSAAFHDALELRPVDERRASLAHYVEFHAAWVTLCATWAPHRLPQALAPLHGLESWSAALSRLQDQDLVSRSASHSALLQTRQVLQQLRLRQTTLASMIDGAIHHIADLEATLRAHPRDDDDSADPALRTSVNEQVISSLRNELESHLTHRAELGAEEGAALQRYRNAREKLARADPTLAALLVMPPLTSVDLAARLHSQEALLITMALPQQRITVVVIRPNATSIVEVNDLPSAIDLAMRYQAAHRALTRGAGLRDGILDARDVGLQSTDADADAEPISPSRLIKAVRCAFWRPLADALLDVQRVHLITGPGHHSVPLECGAQPGVAVHRYFGLPAYLSIHDRPLPLPPPQEVDIMVDAAWDLSPIPFVEAEAELVHTLLKSHGRVRRVRGRQLLEGRTHARQLLLCLHGGVAGLEGREHGYLVLDAAARPPLTLDPPKVGGLSAAIAEVYASACLGAMVGNNDTGSAIGVCSEWQLKGVTSVIACLAPVEDHFMPLLAGLFWYRRLQGQVPYDALEGAKAELQSGDWPRPLIEPMRLVYRKTLRKVLKRAVYREGDDGANRAAQTIAGWLLPPYVRSSYFEPRSIDERMHREFSVSYCERAEDRERLIGQCLGYLIEENARPEDLAVLPFAQAAIDNICAFTHCFGSGGVS